MVAQRMLVGHRCDVVLSSKIDPWLNCGRWNSKTLTGHSTGIHRSFPAISRIDEVMNTGWTFSARVLVRVNRIGSRFRSQTKLDLVSVSPKFYIRWQGAVESRAVTEKPIWKAKASCAHSVESPFRRRVIEVVGPQSHNFKYAHRMPTIRKY